MRFIYLIFVAIAAAVSRAEIPEAHIPSLVLADGRVLSDVQIIGVGNTTVMARWNGGRGSIRLDDLPLEWRMKLAPVKVEQPRQPEPDIYKPTMPTLHPALVIPDFPQIDNTPIHPATSIYPHFSHTISGQCFIVLKGGQNVKLGLVTVSVYPKAAFEGYVKEMEKRTEQRFASMESYLKGLPSSAELEVLDAKISVSQSLSREKFEAWAKLPPSDFETQTDADGKFSIAHSVGDSYVVFARASRLASDYTERYVWVIDSEKIKNPAQLFLSNDNMR